MNRKVLGAESTTVDGIKFRSRLEARLYQKVFKPSGLDIRPEPFKLVLMGKFRPSRPYWIGMQEHIELIRDITYLPDFVYYSNGVPVAIIEVKGGYVTDNYPLKKKMILNTIEHHDTLSYFFEVHNQREAQFVIDKIKQLGL